MYVLKRDGRKEEIMFDKITARVKKLCYGLNELVDPLKVAMRVIEGLDLILLLLLQLALTVSKFKMLCSTNVVGESCSKIQP